jgi:hypothetical protein
MPLGKFLSTRSRSLLVETLEPMLLKQKLTLSHDESVMGPDHRGAMSLSHALGFHDGDCARSVVPTALTGDKSPAYKQLTDARGETWVSSDTLRLFPRTQRNSAIFIRSISASRNVKCFPAARAW